MLRAVMCAVGEVNCNGFCGELNGVWTDFCFWVDGSRSRLGFWVLFPGEAGADCAGCGTSGMEVDALSSVADITGSVCGVVAAAGDGEDATLLEA